MTCTHTSDHSTGMQTKSIAELETAAQDAVDAHDKAERRQAALQTLVDAFRVVAESSDNGNLTDDERVLASNADYAIREHRLAALRRLRVVGEEIRGPLTDAVNASAKALNEAPEEAA